MATSSLDELVRLWGEDGRPVLVPDLEWAKTGGWDFGQLACETQIKFFEYMGAGGISHRFGLFEEHHAKRDVTFSLDELALLLGKSANPVLPDPRSTIADVLYFGLAPTEIHIKRFKYTGVDGKVRRAGLLGEEDVSQDGKTMTSSLDDFLSLWGDEDLSLGEDGRPVLAPDLDWARTGGWDFGQLANETRIKFFEFMGADEIKHRFGLFVEDYSRRDVMFSLHELASLWGGNATPLLPDPVAIRGLLPNSVDTIADVLYFGLAPTEIHIKRFKYTGADGIVCRVGLLGEEDVSQDWTTTTSSLDEFFSLWGDEDLSLAGDHEATTIKDMLEFALTATEKDTEFFETATEKDTEFFEHTGADGIPRRVGLIGKDVRQGALVVRLLKAEWHPTVHRQTVMCLANLAVSHESQVKIASLPGVLHALLGLLLKKETVDLDVVEQTAKCLCHLAAASENQVRIASHPGVLDTLLSLLLEGSSAGVLEQTAKCLTHLAELRENQVKITSYPGMLTAMVRLMKSWNSRVREQTVKCLTSLTVLQENQVKIVSHPGLLCALVSLLENKETTKVQWHSLKCLTTLSDHFQQNKIDIASYQGVLDTLVRLLKYNWITTDRISVQEEAAGCLVNLASAYHNLRTIAFHTGTLDALVKCLGKYTLQRVQDLAAECLRHLATLPENRQKIATHPGALAAIVRMLVQDVNPRGQEEAAWCLQNLATAQESKRLIASKRGVLDALVRILGDSSSLALQPTVRCMVSLSLLSDKQAQIACYPGVLEALVGLLGRDVDSSVLEHTARCLSLLALEPENQGKIGSYPGALDALATLLAKDRRTIVLEQTAKCLTNLAEYPENKVKIASVPGVLQALLFLSSKDVKSDYSAGNSRKICYLPSSVQKEILRCLAKLSESQENRTKIASFPGARDVLMRLTARDPVGSSSQELALRCLSNLHLSSRTNKYPGFHNGGQPNLLLRDPSLSDLDPSYLDPLTHNIMCDPVKCDDGRTYDRWTIIHHKVSSVRHPIDSNHSVGIEKDDIDVRGRVFEAFPQQATLCSARRRKHREEALQHARAEEFEDAVEKLNSVLEWAPEDEECQNELERILTVLEQSIDPDRWDMDPLTFDRMCDPIKCNDGRTYDRWTIINRNQTMSPYDSNLKHFGIVMDDLNVRRRLFEEFPEQEALFRRRRTTYREEALEHAQNGEVEDAIRKLSNVLKWAHTDQTCRQQFQRNLNLRRMQKIPLLLHEDLVRQSRRDFIAQMSLPTMVLLFVLGVVWILESGLLSCRVQCIFSTDFEHETI